jgi:hypothetical protein
MAENDVLSMIEHRRWLLLAAAGLMVLVPFLRTVAARAGLTGTRDRIVSVVASYLQDLSLWLPLLGYSWWWLGLVLALRGPMFSGGLADLLAGVLKRGGGAVAAGAAVALLICGSGCAGQQVDISSCIQAAIRAATDVIAECLPRTEAGEACPVAEPTIEREAPYPDGDAAP